MIRYIPSILLSILSLLTTVIGCSSSIVSTEIITLDAGTIAVVTTVTKTVTTSPLTTNNVIFSFTGLGDGNTPTFSIDTSPWILQYSTDFSGTLTIYIEGDSSEKLIAGGVHAGELYKNYFYNRTGSKLYFRVVSDPPGGGWTLTVLNVPSGV